MESRYARGAARAASRMAFVMCTAAVVCATGLGKTSRAQEGASTEKPGGAAFDLGTRFRFQQRFALGAEKVLAGAITQYKAAFKLTTKTVTERERGAPDRAQATFRVRYVERPVEASATDDRKITGAIRRYETVELPPESQAGMIASSKFKDLTIWYRPPVGFGPAEVLTLDPDHQLTDLEYKLAAAQPFVPDFAFVLPDFPTRVGEGWRLGRPAATVLVGRPAQHGLNGKFVEIRDDPKGLGKRAILDIKGQTQTADGPASVHAQIDFAFSPPAAPVPPANPDPLQQPPPVELVGEIVRIAMAIEMSSQVDERLRESVRKELVLECDGSDPGPLLDVPATAPQLTVENSWLTYTDAAERFHFRHPQDVSLGFPDPDSILLERARMTGVPDRISLELRAKSELEPEALRKAFYDGMAKRHQDFVPGEAGWLPEADWPKMKVYRLETAVTLPDNGGVRGQRVTDLRYVVLTGRESGLVVTGITGRDPSTLFRQQVESIIKTFDFGPVTSEKP